MTKTNEEILKFDLIYDIERNYETLLKIMELYYESDYISEYTLDIQLYEESEPRIWLTNSNNRLGINLMLYSIKLSSDDVKLNNNDAMDVFNEYMKYYTFNKEIFKSKNTEKYQVNFKINFKTSLREL